MVDDMSWDHSAENFEEERLLLSQGSHSTSEDDNIMVPRRQLYMLLLDLRRSQDALVHHIRQSTLQRNLDSGTDAQNVGYRHPCSQCCIKWLQWIPKYILLITITLQIVDIVILTVIDFAPDDSKNLMLIIGQVIMVTLMVLNLLIGIFASVDLAKKLYHHHPTAMLLAQTYMSTVLLFAGIYIAIQRLDDSAWFHVFNQKEQKHNQLVVELYCRFLYFSVSTGTLSGVADLVPSSWYSWLLVSFQMMLSYIYFGAVLSQAVGMVRASNKPRPRSHTYYPRLANTAMGSVVEYSNEHTNSTIQSRD